MKKMRIFNHETCEVMEITFELPIDAEDLELVLNFLDADYDYIYDEEE